MMKNVNILDIKKLYALSELFSLAIYDVYFNKDQYELYNTIIFSMIKAASAVIDMPCIICSNTEHKYIYDILNIYSKLKIVHVVYVNADIYGKTPVENINKEISRLYNNHHICLIITSYVNYMTGAINDIKSITECAHKYNIPVFSDCIYTYLQYPIHPEINDIDIFTTKIKDIYSLTIKKNLITGYNLHLYHPIYSTGFNLEEPVIKNIIQYLSKISHEDIEKNNHKLSNLQKNLKSAFKKISTIKVYTYDDIIKNNTVPKESSIVLFETEHSVPYVFSLMYFTKESQLKKIKAHPLVISTDNNIFTNIGIKEKYLKNIITFCIQNITKKDLKDLIALFSK